MAVADGKDRFGDTLRAAERAKEDIYFAKVDQELLEKIREEQAEAKAKAAAKDAAENGNCPRCKEPLRSGLWRELQIEFCPECGGLWLDPADLLHLADQGDVNLHLTERGPSDKS